MTAAGLQQKETKQAATRRQVLALIEELGVGTQIPSERRLSADLGVSRLTVRAALDRLAREGYLVRRRGSGTYVQQPSSSEEQTMLSFAKDMLRRGMAPESRTLTLHAALAGARLGRLLDLSPSVEILVITRLRLADGETMALETLHLPKSLAPGLKAKDLNGSSDEPYRERYGIDIASATQVTGPTVTNREESDVLGVPLHAPAFLIERTSRDRLGRTLEFSRSIYRGDRYRIVTELRRRQG